MISTSAQAESALRVTCEEADEGSKIYINGKYKGDCSSALFLPAGNVKLRVVMPVDDEYEKVYEKEFYLADNSAKKIEVSLSGPQLSVAAIKERKRKKEQLEKETASAALIKAKKGDVKSMKAVAQYYEQGTGLPQNSKKAEFWSKKATLTEQRAVAINTLKKAKAGDVYAMESMSRFYTNGEGVKQDKNKAKKWEHRAKLLTEKNNAESALRAAKSGDIASMRKISSYYADGTGIKKNLAESQSWSQKAQIATDKQNKKAQKANSRRKAERELEEISFFGNTKSMMDKMNSMSRKPGSSMSGFTYVTLSWGGLTADIISSPYITVKMSVLKMKIASRPSTFGNPNSMIAKAYAQKTQQYKL